VKIRVTFDTPTKVLQTMAEELGSIDPWILGLAIGNIQGEHLIDSFKMNNFFLEETKFK
jgi:hypothetical protein